MSQREPGNRRKSGRNAKRRAPRPETLRRAKAPSLAPHTGADEQKPSTVILEGIKKVGSPRKRGKELKVQGMSLGVKFALVISLVAASLCCLASFVVYFQTKKALLAEIDRKGATSVKAVASLAKAYYQQTRELEHKQLTAETKEDKEKYAKEKYKVAKDYEAALQTMVSYTVDKEVLYSEEILNVCIYSCDVNDLQAGKCNMDNLKNTSDYQQYTELIEEEPIGTYIEVADGLLSQKGIYYKVRVYRVNVFPEEKKKLEAYVSISKKDIERTTGTVLFAILLVTLVAIGVGVLISVLLARLVTQPLRFLIQDVERVSSGDLDHTTVSTSRDEIGILARTFNVMTQNLKLAHQNELERQAREYELQIATDIQSHLLPSKIPKVKDYEIAAFYLPSKEVGGDYYDFLEIDSNHIGFIVADVSGKSIPGSMVMTMARALIRMQAFRTLSPAKMFSEVNRVLCKDIRKGMFVTAMYGVLDIASGELTLSSAGHNPAVIWRASTGQIEEANPKGMALGLAGSATFDKTIVEKKYQINFGDSVLFYTDGVPEAMSPDNEEFGEERFYRLVEKHGAETPNQVVNILVHTLEKWRRDYAQSDDITIVTFKRKQT